MRHSVRPPARATFGWMIAYVPDAMRSRKLYFVCSDSPPAKGTRIILANLARPALSSGARGSSNHSMGSSSNARPTFSAAGKSYTQFASTIFQFRVNMNFNTIRFPMAGTRHEPLGKIPCELYKCVVSSFRNNHDTLDLRLDHSVT